MMKGRMVGLVSVGSTVLILVFALAGWAEPQASTEVTRTVTVTGDAEVRVVPDEAILSLGVETWDKNLEAAQRENSEIVARILSLVAEYGIPAEHIQTEFVSIEPRYRNGYYEARLYRVFRAQDDRGDAQRPLHFRRPAC
jgi:uncharacterized protein YggE